MQGKVADLLKLRFPVGLCVRMCMLTEKFMDILIR